MHDIMAVLKECFMNDSLPSDTVVLGLKHDMWQTENVMNKFFGENLDSFWCSSTIYTGTITQKRSVRKLKHCAMNQQNR
jgi:hypothetical protein